MYVFRGSQVDFALVLSIITHASFLIIVIKSQQGPETERSKNKLKETYTIWNVLIFFQHGDSKDKLLKQSFLVLSHLKQYSILQKKK